MTTKHNFGPRLFSSFRTFCIKKLKLWRPFVLLLSNYGRNAGWYIEYQGEMVGQLLYVQKEDMFWDSYELISAGKEKNSIFFNPDNWNNCSFTFRNKALDQYAKNAFSAVNTSFFPQKRVCM